ncbi:hypothetical protein BYT27DRAFT_7087831, partial [Phlegmacium glaucopus]
PVIDAEGFTVCPDCCTHVKCSPGGFVNLEKRHCGTATCKQAQILLRKITIFRLVPDYVCCISSLANSFFPLVQGKKVAKRDKSGRFKKPRA